jgi:energy-converting hydrogenase Eha subunit F
MVQQLAPLVLLLLALVLVLGIVMGLELQPEEQNQMLPIHHCLKQKLQMAVKLQKKLAVQLKIGVRLKELQRDPVVQQ